MHITSCRLFSEKNYLRIALFGADRDTLVISSVSLFCSITGYSARARLLSPLSATLFANSVAAVFR